MEAIDNDTKFLAKNNLIDYSLLVGKNLKEGTLVVGIIDYLGTFSAEKKLEFAYKGMSVKLGIKDLHRAVLPPLQYRIRFLDDMTRYFLVVPEEKARPKLLVPLTLSPAQMQHRSHSFELGWFEHDDYLLFDPEIERKKEIIKKATPIYNSSINKSSFLSRVSTFPFPFPFPSVSLSLCVSHSSMHSSHPIISNSGEWLARIFPGGISRALLK